MCKLELGTLFTHISHETGWDWLSGLYYVTENYCTPEDLTKTACNYASSNWSATAWPPASGQQYYGRGPFQLSWNYNYGPFSAQAYADITTLLNNPGLVAENGDLAILSALWFYMTPASPKPSMHDVVTGFWQPNSVDAGQGITSGFGTTINIINGGLECGKGTPTSQAQSRQEAYANFAQYYGFEVVNPGCENMQAFTTGGDQSGYQNWDVNWSASNECKLSQWATKYSLWNAEDYKNCVRENFANNSEATFLQ